MWVVTVTQNRCALSWGTVCLATVVSRKNVAINLHKFRGAINLT
jgi:hypothetical protein